MRRFVIIAVAVVTASMAQAAGVRFFDVPADSKGPKLTGAVWYPCVAPSREIGLWGRVVTGTRDCPLAGDKLPLVVVSHGRTGWFGGHHDTATALADAGFIVAAINHPGDSVSDKSRVDQLSVLVQRPADIKRLTDFMLETWPDRSKIDATRIGFFGFSMGGYTGLVLIGGIPDLRKDVPGCRKSDFRACVQLRNNELPPAPPTHDPRIKAAVIADPAPGFLFPAENLKAVTAAVQLWSSDPKLAIEHVSGCCALGIKERLPSKPDFHLASNAIHFSFLAPCSAEEKDEFPRICNDQPDFDRAAFHKDFNAQTIAFFRANLMGDEKR